MTVNTTSHESDRRLPARISLGVVTALVGVALSLVLLPGGSTSFPRKAVARPIITPYAADGNVDGTLGLTAEGRNVVATGWFRCVPEDGEWRLRAEITQGDVTGDGYTVGRCSGGKDPWEVRAAAVGSDGFGPGAAEACVFVAAIGDKARDRPRELYTWCAGVTLVD